MHRTSLFLESACLVALVLIANDVLAGQTLPSGGGSQPFSTLQPTTAVNYLIRTSGNTADLGEVGMFASDIAPFGWTRPEGQLLEINQNQDLFDLLGTKFGGDGISNFALPDMRGRIPIGAGTGPGLPTYMLGDQVGSETTTLSLSQTPDHAHNFGNGLSTDLSGTVTQGHSNMQPSLVLTPIIATQGTFPSRSSTIISSPEEGPSAIGLDNSEPFIGEVSWIAHDEIPNGWERAEGQVISINSNVGLFSILGTMYGGDGRTTFALPDLRGRTPVGTGAGPGLDLYNEGTKRGSESEILTAGQVPTHAHPMTNGFEPTDPFGSGAPQSHVQPTIGLTHLVALEGSFPSEPATAESDGEENPQAIGSSDPFLSSISMFAGNYAIRGFEKAEGQLLPISQYSALFALIWDEYGGDAMSNFALPDLRSRATTHHGSGNGLTPRVLAEEFGVEESSLDEANLPWHVHTFTLPPLEGDFNDDGIVDAADYTVWRDFLGVPAELLPNDVDGGSVGQAQYDTWRQNYGQTIQQQSGPSLAQSSQAIPEPSAWLMILIGLITSHFKPIVRASRA